MALDPITIGTKIWLAVKPFKRWKERRARKRATRNGVQQEEVIDMNMDMQQFLTQALMAFVRHGLTAAGFAGVLESDQLMTQIAAAVSLVVGGVWSLWRKWKAAKTPQQQSS